MVMGSGSNVNKSKRLVYDLNVEHVDDEFVSDCPICLEPMVNKDDDRTLVKLRCDHTFHLDCIGSAFNAKKKMQCPYCRNVEQGRWLYATGLPLTNFNVENRIAEFCHRFSTDLVFGMEVCPFRDFGHLNPFVQPYIFGPNIFSHERGQDGVELCPYIEYNVVSPRSIVAVGDTSSRDVPNPYSLHADQHHHQSNPSNQVPYTLLPTNPRIFRDVSHPEVIRARHYFAHLFIDQSHFGFGILTANVPLFPPYLSSSLVANAPMAWSYLGENLRANALVANATMAQTYLGGSSLANALVVPPLIGGLPIPVWHNHMFLYDWGLLARGVTDFWSTQSGLNHMMYGGGGGINSMGGETGSNERGSSSGGESSIIISDENGRSGGSRESGSNSGGESRNSRGEHRSQ